MNIVSSYPIPTACVANDTLVCAGQQVNLGCAALPNQTYNWFEPTGTNYSPDRYNSNPFIKPQIDTTYRIEVKNQYGCKDTAEIHVSIIPFIVPAAGRDTAICIGGSALLFAQGGNTYSWVNKKTQDLLTTASALIVSPPFPDEFIYTATINGTCNSDLIDVHVTVFPLPSVVLNKDINDVIAGHEVRIPQVGAAGGFYTYLWNPNYNIDSITSGSPTVWPEVTTTYQVLLTDIHGCSDTSEVTVHVLCNASNAVYIPNAFIPGTGVNGTFYVQGKGVKQLNYLRIYDRWGSLVYSVESSPINNPTSGWDGNFNGSPMPSGVFMYQMEVQCAEGEVFPLTGTMTLIR
jgi:gliding motility-associated-like protein